LGLHGITPGERIVETPVGKIGMGGEEVCGSIISWRTYFTAKLNSIYNIHSTIK
jgi:hypothetical protein